MARSAPLTPKGDSARPRVGTPVASDVAGGRHRMAQRRRSRSAPGPRTGPAHHLDLNLATARRSALAAFERVYVVRQLRRHGGDVEKTAARTGISPGTLRALIARH